MITKKKILQHALWGGVLGLIGGMVIAYFEKMKYFENYNLVFAILISGIFIGVTLGIADKNARKGFYGILGGMLGAIIYYVFKDVHYHVEMLLLIISLPLCIGLCMGIAYKSLKVAILGILGGIFGVTAVMFFVAAMALFGLVWTPAMGGRQAFLPSEAARILMETAMVALVATGIFIGTELGEKS